MSAVHESHEDVGVLMAPERRVWATQIIEFLGWILDTLLMIVHIPQDKIDDIRSHLAALKSATEAHANSLKSLVGKLNFISKAFPMGGSSWDVSTFKQQAYQTTRLVVWYTCCQHVVPVFEVMQRMTSKFR